MLGSDVEMTEVEAEYAWIWRAWHRLTHERQWQTRGIAMPMGGALISPFPCAIPWSAVQHWCDVHDYGEAEADFFDSCLMAMDEVFVTWFSEQAKQQAKTAG